MEIQKLYSITSDEDNTLKQLVERFYIIPKEKNFTEDERIFLENNRIEPANSDVANGLNGYIIFRHAVKRFSPEEVEVIRADKGLSQRQLAKKYKCSTSIINKIVNNKY